MTEILSPTGRAILEHFVRNKVLVALDFDGTLAPIVDEPDAAQMKPSTRGLLSALTEHFPCIVISGRAQPDILRRLHGVRIAEVIGNHGLEPWRYSAGLAAHVQRWVERLGPQVAALPGVELEDKVFSLAIHFRKSTDHRSVRHALIEMTTALDDVRLIGGKQVINLVPAGAPNKGDALLAARRRLGCDAAIYVGDDETDEDVFTLGADSGVLSIRVEPNAASAARYVLGAQQRIDELLRFLCDVRLHGPSARHA